MAVAGIADQFRIDTSISSPIARRSEDDPMAKKSGKTKKVTARRYRDALTGRFVTKKYAKKHRKTTVKESRTPA